MKTEDAFPVCSARALDCVKTCDFIPPLWQVDGPSWLVGKVASLFLPVSCLGHVTPRPPSLSRYLFTSLSSRCCCSVGERAEKGEKARHGAARRFPPERMERAGRRFLLIHASSHSIKKTITASFHTHEMNSRFEREILS
ncbi:hypothetical protein AVEN_135046-1 [Araneus ventricosus]|uniref:Uncharacterized protein n=1 Tax=Araneus ventricosus TaxID=182803 RepID=A0A4Y2D016_ARAVE|nr:hypothetical protein AVEN_135046-1 [Araneus ventricosus]